MLGYILVSLAFGMAGGIIYYYFQKKGQFDDMEEAKYQMLREDDLPLKSGRKVSGKKKKEQHILSFGDEPIINQDK